MWGKYQNRILIFSWLFLVSCSSMNEKENDVFCASEHRSRSNEFLASNMKEVITGVMMNGEQVLSDVRDETYRRVFKSNSKKCSEGFEKFTASQVQTEFDRLKEFRSEQIKENCLLSVPPLSHELSWQTIEIGMLTGIPFIAYSEWENENRREASLEFHLSCALTELFYDTYVDVSESIQ